MEEIEKVVTEIMNENKIRLLNACIEMIKRDCFEMTYEIIHSNPKMICEELRQEIYKVEKEIKSKKESNATNRNER